MRRGCGPSRIRSPATRVANTPPALLRREECARDQLFLPAAVSYAPHRTRFEIIRTGRDTHVMLAGRDAVRDIEAPPPIEHPAFGPRVARDRRIALRQIKVPAHVTRGNAKVTAARDE